MEKQVINVTCEKSHHAAVPDYQLEDQDLSGLPICDIRSGLTLPFHKYRYQVA